MVRRTYKSSIPRRPAVQQAPQQQAAAPTIQPVKDFQPQQTLNLRQNGNDIVGVTPQKPVAQPVQGYGTDKMWGYNNYVTGVNQPPPPPTQQPVARSITPFTDSQQQRIDSDINNGMKDMRSWYAQRQAIAADESRRKNNKARLGAIALGDAMRHIANLAGTMNGATPMQFGTPVQDEYARQVQDEQQRTAAQMAREKLAAEQAEKDRRFGLDSFTAQSNAQYKGTMADVARNNDNRNQQIHPYKMLESVYKSEGAKSDAAKKSADAKVAVDTIGSRVGQEAQKEKNLVKTGRYIDAGTNLRGEQAKTQKAQQSKIATDIQKTKQDMKIEYDGAYIKYLSPDNKVTYAIPRETIDKGQMDDLISVVKSKISDRKPGWENTSLPAEIQYNIPAIPGTSGNSGKKYHVLIQIALQHKDDPDIMQFFESIGQKGNSNTSGGIVL